MGRAPCCDKANVKKGPWSPEEDAKLKSYIDQNGTGGNWIALPHKIGLKRCGKSCRLRWLNYLRPNIKHGGFSEEEDNIICSLYINIGSRWSIIAAQLPGRTDNDIKNYWNTRLKKKLLGKQRKEQAALVRRINSQKQETEKHDEDNFSFPSMMMTQTRYWGTEPPVSLPTLNSNQNPKLKDQTSLRNLLMKLRERFSHDFQYPVVNSHSQDTQFHESFNFSADSSALAAQLQFSMQFEINKERPTTNIQGSDYEFNEMGFKDLVQLDGFDDGFYHGMEMMGNSLSISSGSSSAESSSWGEMSSLGVYDHPLLLSDYETSQLQGLAQAQGPAFEECSHLGFQ